MFLHKNFVLTYKEGSYEAKHILSNSQNSVLKEYISFCTDTSNRNRTRRDRLKSAPYLRLKNIQRTTIGNIWKNYFQKLFF